MRNFFFVISLFCFSYCFSQYEKELYQKAVSFEKINKDSSINYYKKIVSYLKNDYSNKAVGKSYQRISQLFKAKSDYAEAIKYGLQALKSFEVLKDSVMISSIYNNIAVYFSYQQKYTDAFFYCNKSGSFALKIHSDSLIISHYMLKADMLNYNAESNFALYDSSIYFLNKAYLLSKSSADKHAYGLILNNLGNTYYNMAEEMHKKEYYAHAIKYAQLAVDYIHTKNDSVNLAYSYGLLGAADKAIKNYSKAEESYKNALSFYTRAHDNFNLEIMYYEMTALYLSSGKNAAAEEFFKLHDSISRVLINETNLKNINQLQIQFETEKKETENKLLQTENELSGKTIKQQKLISYFIVGVLVLALLFSLFIFRGLKAQRKANRIISKQKDEVHHQKEIVEEKQKEILDSIHYAKRIQRAVITSDAYIAQYLKNYFIYYQPKDIVSGDFYWALQVDGKFYLATADCTGHGVPGAFMSLLNISILNEVMIEKKITRPDLVLNEARKDIIKSLNPTGSEESKDGMDCILACFDFENSKLEYAAANNSFYIVRDKMLITCPADKMPVGKSPRDTETFTLHTVDLQKGDTVYMLTDGLPDQFGGPKGKKYKYKQLEDLLVANNEKSLAEQKEILNTSFHNWKGNLEQVDDVLLIGIKI
jgi:serine phosphatase RsbU (regulator of sigma subunit)